MIPKKIKQMRIKPQPRTVGGLSNSSKTIVTRAMITRISYAIN
jgi:hypothetical protein